MENEDVAIPDQGLNYANAAHLRNTNLEPEEGLWRLT